MATYRIQGPDGKNYAFDAPPGLSAQQIEIIKGGLFPAPAAPEPVVEQPQGTPGFIPSVIRGGRGIASLFGDVLPAMGAKALGFEDYAKRQMQEAAEYQKETQRLYPAEVPSFTDIKGVGSALTYVKEAIGEAIPSILPSIFTGGAAGVLSGGAQKAAYEVAKREAIAVANKAAEREIAEAAAKGVVDKALADSIAASAVKAGQDAARRVALKAEVTGALAGSAAQNIPEVYQNIYEQGEGELPDLAPALISGGFNAVLDAITPINILRKARSAGIPEKEIIGAWYKRAGKGAAEGFFTEGATEAIQEMSSAAAEAFVNQNSQFFTPQNFVRFIDAGLKGGFGGAAITGATNVLYGRKEELPAKPSAVTEEEKTTEETAGPPLVDIESKEFKKKQAKYEDLAKGIAELEAKGDQLTSREKGTLTGRRNKAAALKAEIDAALAQNAPEGAEDVSGVEPSGVGGGFEISELPGETAGTAGVGAAAPSTVGGVSEAAGITAGGAGEQPTTLKEAAPATAPAATAPAATAPAATAPAATAPAATAPAATTPAATLTATPAATTPAITATTPATPPGVKLPQGASIRKAQSDLDFLDGLMGEDDSTLLAARRTKKEIEIDEKLDALGAVHGLKRKDGEGTKDFALRVRNAINFSQRLETTPVSEMENVEIAKQELREEKPYFPPEPQRALYEETREEFNAGIDDEAQRAYESTYRDAIEEGLPEEEATKLANQAAEGFEDDKLPQYRALTDDARRVYFQNHISRNDQTEHDTAAQALSGYLASKRQESRAGIQVRETEARESYNREREAFSRPTSLRYNFPRWNDLSEESKKIYASLYNVQGGNTVLQQQLAFKAVKAQIRKDLAEKQRQEYAAKTEIEVGKLEEAATKREKKSQPAGKGEPLSEVVLKALSEGDIKAALNELEKNAEGLKPRKYRSGDFEGYGLLKKWKTHKGVIVRDSVARMVFRNLARAINSIPDFNVNIVFDDNLPEGTFGEYDANTNTVYLSKTRGSDEATLLHELTHAATVKIIHQYFTDKSKLTPRAAEAVEHLQRIAAAAKPILGSRIEFQPAFSNLYEFVAYAMTDTKFQSELAQIQIGKVRKVTDIPEGYTETEQEERESGLLTPPPYKTLWTYFTDTLAWLFKLYTPNIRTTRGLYVGEETRLSPSAEKVEAERRKRKKAEKARKGDLSAAEEEFYERETEEAEKALEAEKRRRKTPKKALKEEEEAGATPSGIEKLFDEVTEESDVVTEEDKEKASIPLPEDFFASQYGVDKLYRAVLREPGYRGNMLLEVAAAFEDILAAPEGGIKKLAGKTGESRLQAKAPETKKAEGKPPSEYSDEEFLKQVLEQVKIREAGGKEFLKNLLSARGYDWLVQKFQNERHAVKKIFERAAKFGIIKRIGEGINDVWGQITRSTGMAVDLYATHMKPLADEVHEGIEAYAKRKNISLKKALEELHLIFETRHEGERRAVKYILKAPLDDQKKFTIKGFNDNKGQPLAFTADGWREHILERLSSGADLAPTEDARRVEAQRLRGLLDQIVADKRMRLPEGFKIKTTDSRGRVHQETISKDHYNVNSELYNVIASRTPEEIDRIKRLLDTDEVKDEVKKISDALYGVEGRPGIFDETKRLNREANYWSEPVQNIADFYGYKNYVPFKGRPEDDNLALDSKRIGGELQEMQNRFEGRVSESNNPLLQSLAEGAQAAMRAGRKDLTLAIKNAIKDKILTGKVHEKQIKFADRYLKGETKKELGGPNKIFHYNEDGTIDVLEISNKQQLEAIRRSFRTSQPIIDIINSITSTVGQTHTRYNPAFAPMNFVRDSLTNAFTLGAELGPVMAGRLIKQISAETASGGIARAMKFSHLYSNGNFAEINRLAGGTAPYESLNEQQRYYRDLLDYVKLGGRVSYLQGVASKGALDGLMKEVGRSGVLKTKDQMDKFFDVYNEMFELAARVGAFRVMRDEFRAKGESREEAQVHAVEYAKNLANFEQVGEWGKAAGAAFMFFRPAATGAVRAIDALRPAFGFNEEEFRATAAEEGRTPEEIERGVVEMRKQQKSARAMAAGLVGMGVAVYLIAMMMSGDDDQGRNRVATDDMARWTRNARIFIPGFEKPLQLPWGFGMGAFAAAGAQIAALVSGKLSLTEMADNIKTIGFDSFLPLPLSRISAIDNFPAFVLDSITPSVARPFFEYVMNLDGLGREIYNNRQTRYGDAYTGGDSIPELYKDAARMLFNATKGGVDVSPNTMYFFAGNFLDGFMKVFSSSYNLGLTLTGRKDVDLKNDIIFASSFIGTKSNIDAREFSKAENYIKELDKRINALKSKPELLVKFAEEEPEKFALVQMYNHQVNGTLRNLRAAANQIRAAEMPIPERKARLDEIIRLQNVVKRQILDGFEAVAGYKP